MAHDRETLEAQARQLMAKHAAITPRGYDTTRTRNQLHAQIDALLDAHATAPTVHVEPITARPTALHCGICTGLRREHQGVRVCRTCDDLPLPRLGLSTD